MELCVEGLYCIWRSHSAQIKILFEHTKLRPCTVLAAGLCLIPVGNEANCLRIYVLVGLLALEIDLVF